MKYQFFLLLIFGFCATLHSQSIRWNFAAEPTMTQIEARAKIYYDSVYIANGNSYTGTGYNSWMRKQWFYGMRLGQTKKISEARQIANSYFYNSAQKTTAPVCSEGSNWAELGPNTWPILPANDNFDFHAGIGIMCFLKAHPGYNGSTNKILYAGGPSGLWKSINGGDNWSLLNTDKNTITSCSDIAIHPTTNVLYLASGAHQSQSLFDPFGTAYEESRGLLKSADGGGTWNDVGPHFQSGAYPDMQYAPVKIGAVRLHPTNHNVVYVVAYFWSWANNGRWEGKLFKSIDAGSTWNVIYNATDTHLLNMEFKPGEPGTFFVSGFKLLKFTDTPTNTSVLVPADWTSKLGSSWRPNTSSNLQNQTHTMELELGVTPADGNYLYVAGTQILNPASPGGNNTVNEFSDLWVCTNVTATNPTFTEKNPTGLPSNGGWTHQLNTLSVSTTDKNFVILGGFGVAYSSNGGTSFTHVNAYSPPVKFFHPDTRGTACATANGQNIFFRCHDAGICMSSDNCQTWVNKSTGLGVSRPYSVAVAETPSASNPDKFIIGLQDCATLYTGTGGWEHARNQGGDGMVVLMDPVDPNIMYREAQFGGITKTIDNWATSLSPNYGGFNDIGFGLWVTPMVLDPNNRHRMYVGKENLGISDFTSNPSGSGTPTVRLVANKPPTRDANNEWNGNAISAIGIAPTNSNILFVGYRFGVLTGQPNSAVNRQLFKSTDNGVTWTDVSPINGFTGINNPVLSIVIHPEDPNKIFVTYGGYGWAPGIARVIRSVDGGTTWTDYSSGLPGLPYQTLVINPNRAFDDEMYIGTDVGVFFRNKYMTDWQCFNGTLPNTPVTDLKINRNKKILYAATFGRGIWSSTVYCPASPALTLATSPNNFYASSTSITSTSLISGVRSVAYRAPTITLNANFSVSLGTEFSAWNYNCAQFTPRSNSEEIENASFGQPASQIPSNDYKLTVAPNPTSDLITVSFELQTQELVSLNLMDTKGLTVQSLLTRTMKEKGSHAQSFQISVPSGLYFITIEGAMSRQTHKLIVH